MSTTSNSTLRATRRSPARRQSSSRSTLGSVPHHNTFVILSRDGLYIQAFGSRKGLHVECGNGDDIHNETATTLSEAWTLFDAFARGDDKTLMESEWKPLSWHQEAAPHWLGGGMTWGSVISVLLLPVFGMILFALAMTWLFWQ